MFIRVKKSDSYRYLQIVQNRREGARVVQEVIATLGRVEKLQAGGDIDALTRSLSRFAVKVRIVGEHRAKALEAGSVIKTGPALAFGRLWEQVGADRVISGLAGGRRFSFPAERIIFGSVLHRLFESGSDRSAEKWFRDVKVEGLEDASLHHYYRAMRWLGETKDEIEEKLYHHSRDLFSQASLAFFDTTSFYFYGRGGETLGRYGHSKDHRPDLRQAVVGAVLTEKGRPLSCEIYPGNNADAKSLVPEAERMSSRFGLKRVCWVSDSGMASEGVIDSLEARKLEYILGCRMRRVKEVREEVLGRGGRYREVAENLLVKEVQIEGRRYILCHNPEQAKKDTADRASILEALEEALSKNAKGLIGNKGYRRYVKIERETVRIDEEAAKEDARYDGKFVLRTNSLLSAEEVAVQYKRLLLVEQFFRAAKSLLETRPVYHKYDATIRGHIFVSFLALLLRHELEERLKSRSWKLEWADVIRDLGSLYEVEVREGAELYLLRSELRGVCGKVLQAAGVAIPLALKQIECSAKKV